MADFWNQLGGLVGAGINMAGIESARNDLISAGQQANVGAQQIGQTAFEQSQFKPFPLLPELALFLLPLLGALQLP